MDLPIKLEQEDFVNGVDEIKQSLIALFRTEKGEMMQSKKSGTTSLIHTQMTNIEVDLYVHNVCSQVEGVTHLWTKRDKKVIDGAVTAVLEVAIEYNSQRFLLNLAEINGEEIWL